jgi:hypothetical protein
MGKHISTIGEWAIAHAELKEKYDALRKRIQELEGALKPFAEYAQEYSDYHYYQNTYADSNLIFCDWLHSNWGDIEGECFRAKAALKESE